MIVEFTDFAEEELRKIHCRYPSGRAEIIVEKILSRAETLSTLPNRGRIVEELRVLNQSHRYLKERSYKLIYFTTGEKVYVTDVFSMHDDPAKILKRHTE